jgi:hypothetical protein
MRTWLLIATFFISSASIALSCECECVGGPDGRNSLGRTSFSDSLPPFLQKNYCEELCNGYIPPGSARVARTSTCVFPRAQVRTYSVDWCSAAALPPGIPRRADQGPPPGFKLLTATAWGDDPVVCIDDAEYGKRYRTFCAVADPDHKYSNMCIGTGTSQCGDIPYFGREIFPNDPFYSKCIKVYRQDAKEKWFELYVTEVPPDSAPRAQKRRVRGR